MFASFLDTLVTYSHDASQTQQIMAVVIPFVILMILLMKAKEMAVKYSGEMGKAISKVGAMVGGLALGAATGGLAMAGRQTLGRAAANISQSNKFRDWAAQSKFGKRVAKTVGGAASASYDARGIKVMGKDLGSTGLKVGKNVRTGGFAKVREEKVKKEEEYANKMLDTSDYGMAELTSGKMPKEKADRVINQIKKSGGNFGEDKNGNALNESNFRTKLVMGEGLNYKAARDVADQMNAARRGDRADYLGSKRFMTSKIKSYKVRKDAKVLKGERDRVTMLAQLTKAMSTGTGDGSKLAAPEQKGPSAPAGGAPVGGVHPTT